MSFGSQKFFCCAITMMLFGLVRRYKFPKESVDNSTFSLRNGLALYTYYHIDIVRILRPRFCDILVKILRVSRCAKLKQCACKLCFAKLGEERA